MSTQTCYTKTQTNETIPINIIPSNLIKCTHCNVYVPYNQLQAHTSQHIPVSLQSAYTLQSKANKYETIRKVDLKGVIMDEDSGDIHVRSFLPDEMPAAQSVRSHIKNISNSKQNNPKISTPTNNYKTQYRNLDSMTIHEAPTPQPCNQLPETKLIEKLQFQKSLKLREQHQELKKVQIKYYKSQQPLQNGWYINQVSIPSKIQQLEEDDKENDYYVVNSIKAKNSQDVKNVPMRVHFRSSMKEPAFREKISTVSTGQGFFTARINKQEYDYTDQTTSNKQVNKNECEECHGFYCKTCGSDIPPMYRPVTNISNKKSNDVSAYLSPSTKSFYNSQVYNRSPVGKTSRLTGCSNCQ